MNTKMRTLVKAKPEPGIWMELRPIPDIGPNDVLIKIKKTAICGTDIHIYNWDSWAQKTIPIPLVVGHEYCGEIVDMGQDVKGIAKGQFVSGEGHIVGFTSRAARSGKFHLSPDTRGVGVNLPGAFAEYLQLPAFNTIKLPNELSEDIAAIMDPLGNATHAALSFDLVGEDVLITGAGPIGIMAGAIARHVGARHVVITDVNSYRLKLAETVADICPVDVSKEDLKSVQDKLKMSEGFDVGLEMSGSDKALSQMIDNMVMGGKIALLGVPSAPFSFDFQKIIFKALTVKGIYGREMYETWYKMIAMLQSGLDVSKIITHRFQAEDYQKAFDAMRSGQSGKVVLNWT